MDQNPSITSFTINLYVYEYINSQNEPFRKQLSTICVEKYGVKKVASEYGRGEMKYYNFAIVGLNKV